MIEFEATVVYCYVGMYCFALVYERNRYACETEVIKYIYVNWDGCVFARSLCGTEEGAFGE